MEQFQKIKFFYYFFLILLTSCGKPTVVQISLPGDSDLSCKELDLKVMEAQKIKREAVIASDQTGANIARVAFYWPAWAMTLHNADKAIAAADDRTFHLYKIMKKKNCEESKSVRNLITEKRKYYIGVSKELKELKKLYKSGDLTEEEYVKAKKKVLE